MKFMNRLGLSSSLVGAAMLVAAQFSIAGPIDCTGGGVNDTHSATANGAYADACHYHTENIANPTDITDHTNLIWGAGGDFTYVGKDGEAGDIAGFSLSVSAGEDPYKYSYQLLVPSEWQGVTVDWVLGVKQASNSYMSYLFNDVVLGIDGGYNNFWLNNSQGPQGPKLVNDYSFVAGFIRITDVPVPEPGTALLLATGIFGLVASRKRMKKTA